ncbi:MAG TPA: histidine kinase [Microlunatus sp.]|nr:histidine kinase [Microlunatus sp.]
MPTQAVPVDRPAALGVPVAHASVDGGHDRTSSTATWLVATAVVVVPETALLMVEGTPQTAMEWAARSVPAVVGLAVVATRVRVEVAVTILIVAVLTVFRSADAVLSSPGVWPTVAAITLFGGVCWVTCSLGFRLPVRWSAVWMTALGLAAVWAVGFDVPVTMLGVGWWLVGVTFRHHEQIDTRLRQRADELAAEHERFAAEAVRLERARIARELHDVVAHCMTVIVIQSRAGQQLTEVDPEAAAGALDAILATAREAEQDLDALVGVMDPQQAKPLTQEVLAVIVRRATTGGTRVDLAVRGDPDELDPERAAVAHRVVQEALTNALRHAPGAEISVALDCRSAVTLTVENAPATTPAAAGVGSGRGLVGIAERVADLGGTADWGSTPSGGWRLVVVLP